MSMPHQVTVTCKECGKEHPFTAWESLNVTLDRDAKEHLLNGDLTRFKCPGCGWSGNVIYPMLYHDMEKRLMIWLWTGSGDPDTASIPTLGGMRDYQFRIVSSLNQLIEKILIFDAGLDDRLLEFLKFILHIEASQGEHPLSGEIFFTPVEPGPESTQSLAFQHLTPTGSEPLTISRQAYEQLAPRFGPKLPGLNALAGKWLRIDRPFGQTLARDLFLREPGRKSKGMAKNKAPSSDRGRKMEHVMPDDTRLRVTTPVFLLRSTASCLRCHASEEVIALACRWRRGNHQHQNEQPAEGAPLILENLHTLPQPLLDAIVSRHPHFEKRTSQTAGTAYYMNTCACGAHFGDFYLFSEPGGAFFPTDEAEAAHITIEELPLTGTFELDCSYGMGLGDLIFKHARKV